MDMFSKIAILLKANGLDASAEDDMVLVTVPHPVAGEVVCTFDMEFFGDIEQLTENGIVEKVRSALERDHDL